MGEIAEMMLEGTLCEGCGVYLEGTGDGYPRRCAACETIHQIQSDPWPEQQTHKICRKCGRRVKWSGLSDHMRAKHGSSEGKSVAQGESK